MFKKPVLPQLFNIVRWAPCYAALAYSGGLNAKVLVDADFEVNSLTSYGWIGSGNFPSISGSGEPTCLGKKSMKVALDRYNSIVPYRTEATGIKLGSGDQYLSYGETYWLRFSIYLPSNWKQEEEKFGEILMQMHGSHDYQLGEQGRHPNVALVVNQNRYLVEIKSDPRQVTQTGNYETNAAINLDQIAPGKWTTFVFNFKVSYNNDGFLTVWQDGSKHSYNGPVFYNDKRGPTLRFGNYKPSWNPVSSRESGTGISSRLHYFDELLITDGQASYSDLNVRCTGEAAINDGGTRGESDPLPPNRIGIK